MSIGTKHAGDISPVQAMEALKLDKSAVLVDVRTTAEWDNVGVPDLATVGDEPVLLQWLSYPAMTQNASFTADLSAELSRRGATADSPLLFLCRSGARSSAAASAMAALGFRNSFNIAGGFEGSAAQGLLGWKQSGLPWTRP